MDKAILTAGLLAGDEGKGGIVDYLAHRENADLVVRYCGGYQALHHVVSPSGAVHGFSQFGSGTCAGTRTHLGAKTILNPLALVEEAAALERLGVARPLSMLTIDPRALIVTPYQVAMNRVREIARGSEAHGSCGLGIGETVADSLESPTVLRAGDLRDPLLAFRKFVHIRKAKLAEAKAFGDAVTPKIRSLLERSPTMMAQMYMDAVKGVTMLPDSLALDRAKGTVIFEGAQGVLLDEWHGTHPHTTWSTTTFENADDMLDYIEFDGPRTRIGVTRAYMTRHGAGPFPTEDKSLDVLDGEHNVSGVYQGAFRVGHLDAVLLKYAINVVGGVDELAVTCLDKLMDFKVAYAHQMEDGSLMATPRVRMPAGTPCRDLRTQERWTRELGRVTPVYGVASHFAELVDVIEEHTQARVGIMSFGPDRKSKQHVEL